RMGAGAARRSFLAALLCVACTAAPQAGVDAGVARVLYVTHSGGYRHDCLPTSARVLADVGRDAGLWVLEVSDDAAAVITPERLGGLGAVGFFTPGGLGLGGRPKQALAGVVCPGRGFGGAPRRAA